MTSECKRAAQADIARDPRARNPLKHGAFAKACLLPGEDPGERKALEQAYLDTFQPTFPPERDIVTEIVDLVWRRNRLRRAEAAMQTNAIQEAGLPEPLAHLAIEIRRMELELSILHKLLAQLKAEMNDDHGEARGFLGAISNILVRLLGKNQFDVHSEPAKVLVEGMRVHDARQEALNGPKQVLHDMLEADTVRMEAAKADASLLEPQKASRILQERTMLARAIERQIKLFWELHGGDEVEECCAARIADRDVTNPVLVDNPGNGGSKYATAS